MTIPVQRTWALAPQTPLSLGCVSSCKVDTLRPHRPLCHPLPSGISIRHGSVTWLSRLDSGAFNNPDLFQLQDADHDRDLPTTGENLQSTSLRALVEK